MIFLLRIKRATKKKWKTERDYKACSYLRRGQKTHAFEPNENSPILDMELRFECQARLPTMVRLALIACGLSQMVENQIDELVRGSDQGINPDLILQRIV